MAVTRQHEDVDAQGYNYRYEVDGGDTLTLSFANFGRGRYHRRTAAEPFSLFAVGVWWLVNSAGPTVEIESAFDTDRAAWLPHQTHPEVDEVVGFQETTPVSALRFRNTGSAAVTISLRAPAPLDTMD